jgi:5-methyltetrahydropteroyltriglutamate--homocysteine methyltransferase
VAWVQIDEPMLVTELAAPVLEAYGSIYAQHAPVKIMLTSYFDSLGDNLRTAVEPGTAGLHIDLVRAPEQLEEPWRRSNRNKYSVSDAGTGVISG